MPDADAPLLNLIRQIQPLVPQEWCLSCRRCCRFAETQDVQTPTWSPLEVTWATQHGGASPSWFQPAATPPSREAHLATHGCGYRCPAFEPATNRCRIYETRPLDCRLYPFVLTRDATQRRVVLAVDTQCPYIQHLGPAPALRDYGWYLARLLASAPGQALLAENPALAGRPREEFWTVLPLTDPTPPTPSPAPQGFQPLSACAEAFEAALEESGRPLSAYHRAAWLPWQDLFHGWWGTLGAASCLVVEQAGGYFLALPPLRVPLTADLITRAFALLHTFNGGTAVSRIENVPAPLADQCRRWGYRVQQVDQEYVYDRRRLAHACDSSARRAERHWAVTVRPYRQTDAEACLRLYTWWALQRQAETTDTLARAMLRDNLYVHRRWLEEAAPLGVLGFVAERAGDVVGYTLGISLSQETFVVLAETTDRRIPDLSAVLTSEWCRAVEQPHLNVMGDSGVERLAQAKASQHPQARWPVFVVTPPAP